MTEQAPSDRRQSVEQILFCVAALVVLGLGWRSSRSYPDLVRWFPTAVLVSSMALLLAKIGLELVRLRSGGRPTPD